MRIEFEVEELPVTFRCNSFTGRAELRFGARVDVLHPAFRYSFRFAFTGARAWTREVLGHAVRIEQERLLFGGYCCRVFVDDEIIAERSDFLTG